MSTGAIRRFWLSVRGNARWFVTTTLLSSLAPVVSGLFTWIARNNHGIWLFIGFWFACAIVVGIVNVRGILADRIKIPPAAVSDKSGPAIDASAPAKPEVAFFAPSPDVALQLRHLNLFEFSVVVILLKFGELNGDELTYRLLEAGFPIGSEHTRREVAETAFKSMAGHNSLIAESPRYSGVWSLSDPQSVRALLPDLLTK